jgi:hypothetical protein
VTDRGVNATISRQLGIDHNRLSFKFQRLQRRLTEIKTTAK